MGTMFRCVACEAHFRARRKLCPICGITGVVTERDTCRDCGAGLVASAKQRCTSCGSSDVELVREEFVA